MRVRSMLVALVLAACGGGGGDAGSSGSGGDGGAVDSGGEQDAGSTTADGGGPDAAEGDAGTKATFYVARDGNDAWSGTLDAPNAAKTDGPFATFEGARAHVQALDKKGLTEVHVQIRKGIYPLAATQNLTSADSGSPSLSIVYENYRSEAPVLSGGVRVTGWTNTSGNVWKATLSSTTVNFESLFYNGERRLRPRLGGYLGTYQRIASSISDPSCAGQAGNGSTLCLDRFVYAGTDVNAADTWTNLAPPASNAACTQPRTSKAPAGDVELVLFENYLVAKLRVSCVDTAHQTVFLTGQTSFDAYHPNAMGFIQNHRVLFENVQSALTEPGQWFLDRSTPGAMTLTYLAKAGEDPNKDTVIVPQISPVFVTSGLSYVTFRGLGFAHDNFVIDDTRGYNGATQPTPAVSFQNSQYITFDGNTVSQTSGAGVDFITCVNKATGDSWCVFPATAAVNAHNTIQNGAFYDIGAYAIRIGSGGTNADTQDNVASFNTFENNVVAGWGRAFPGSEGVLQGQGHDNVFAHNEIYDGYKGAIRIHYGSQTNTTGVMPDNNTISFNLVHDLFQGIMNDGGSLYVGVGTPVGPSGPPVSGKGNRILNNVVHDVNDASVMDPDGYNGDGLYVDEYSGQVDLENNLVYRVSGNAVTFSGPRAGANQGSTVKNNVFAYARSSMLNANDPYSFNTQPPSPLFFTATYNVFLFDRNGASTTPGVYPSPPSPPVPAPFYVQGNATFSGSPSYSSFQVWNDNLYFNTLDDFSADTAAFHLQPSQGAGPKKWLLYSFAQWQTTVMEDQQSAVGDPKFKDAPGDDYSLPAGPPMAGFVVFDPKQAGRTKPVLTPPSVPPGFPTQTFAKGDF